MLRHILLGAAALSLLSSTTGCTCLPPPPLSECEVAEDQAALLVTIKCVKTLICDINLGVAVADVVIDKVFEDNTDLGLKKGEMVTVSSLTQSATCGIGLSFQPGAQWIMFASPPFEPPSEPIDDLTSGGRRLRQTRFASVSARATSNNQTSTVDVEGITLPDSDDDGVFSDGSICDVEDADLSTTLCAGNVIDPTRAQINQLMSGCSD